MFSSRLTFTHAEDVFSVLENVATVGVPELLEANKIGASNTYPTLTRQECKATQLHLPLANKGFGNNGNSVQVLLNVTMFPVVSLDSGTLNFLKADTVHVDYILVFK